MPVLTNKTGGRRHFRPQGTPSAPARPRPRARRGCPEPQQQPCAPPSSGSPRPHRHFEPHIRANGISGDGLQLSQAGSVFEPQLPKLCPCLRSCQCPPTTAADLPMLVRKVVRQRRRGRGRVLAELAQRLSGRAAHLQALVLPDHTATSSPTSMQSASLATDCNCGRPGPCLSCDSRSCAPACDRASAHQPPRRTPASSSSRHFVSAGTAEAACSPRLPRATVAARRTSELWFSPTTPPLRAPHPCNRHL